MVKPLTYWHKSQVVFEYLHKYSIDTFVETGTYEGAGVISALAQVKKVYSIELDETRYTKVQKLFAPCPNVHVFQGDSAEVLPEIMPKITGRCLFWLDAHISDKEGYKDTPIFDELKCVLKYSEKFILLIDDARLYTGEGDWPTLKALESFILESYPDCNIEIKDDIIRVVPNNIHAIAEDKFVSMSTLGHFGRFGNQIFQYAALKIYAATHGLRAEVPSDWIGRKMFMGCNDLSISNTVRYQITPTEDMWLNGDCFEGNDIKGYCQYHTSLYAPYKNYFRLLFGLIPNIEETLKGIIEPLKKGTLVGIHIRLSDYRLSSRSKNIAPIQWYLDWLKQNWDKLDNPILFIASDEIDNVIVDFKKYAPQAFSVNADFLFDYYALSHCDILLISNSTFSFTAAMLNEKGREFHRPDFEQEKMVSFDPWNAKPLLEPV